MKKLFSTFVLCVLFASVSFAQNAYIGTSFGFDINMNNGKNTNQALNVQIGYFFDYCQAVEFDYSHGFQKDFMYYNRVGANYVFEFDTHEDMTAPYIKLGAAYKTYNVKDLDVIGVCDLKFALGIHQYINPNISINLGINFTNGFNNDIDWEWENTQLQLNIGLSYYF